MNLLLDSHALLWALAAPQTLSAASRYAIANPRNAVYFSSASVWELELKASRGKLTLPQEWLAAVLETGFVEVTVTSGDAVAAARLPWHHQDPFDRMLVAQARARSLQLATRDRILASYDVPLLEV